MWETRTSDRWDRRVTRSLGDGVHVVPMERMVAEWSLMFHEIVNIMCDWSHSYDERMLRSFVVQNFHVGRTHVLPGPRVAPINKIQVKPRFVMAALIIWSQAMCFPWDGECTMLIHFPGSLRARRLSTDVGPIVRNGSRSPQWSPWCGQDTVQKCFVNSTEVVFAAVAVPLKSPAT